MDRKTVPETRDDFGRSSCDITLGLVWLSEMHSSSQVRSLNDFFESWRGNETHMSESHELKTEVNPTTTVIILLLYLCFVFSQRCSSIMNSDVHLASLY